MSTRELDPTYQWLKKFDPLALVIMEAGLVGLVGWLVDWPNLGWMIAAYPLFRWLAIALYQLGAFAGARLGGLTTPGISIGVGPSVAVKQGTTPVRLGLWPTAGAVEAGVLRYSGFRTSRLLHAVGGLALSVPVLIGLLIWSPGPLGWVAVMAQAFLLLNVLLPIEVPVEGADAKAATDGLTIVRLLFRRDPTRARREEWFATLDPPRSEPAEILTAATALLNDPGLEPMFLPNIQGTVAYYIAVLGETERYAEADWYSLEAVEVVPSDANIGSVPWGGGVSRVFLGVGQSLFCSWAVTVGSLSRSG